MGYQPTSPAFQPRLRVTWDLHWEADTFVKQNMTPGLEVWRDNKGRWSVSPKET